MKFVIKLLLYAVAIILAGELLPGVHVDGGYGTAFLVAALLALLNMTLKPLLVILTIPVTILTLGLFVLVINASMILLADYIISDFRVDSFWWALFFSIIVSILNGIFTSLAFDKK